MLAPIAGVAPLAGAGPLADVTIGKILKPVGLRGELRVLPFTDFPERFKTLDRVTVVTKEGTALSYRIRSTRRDHRFVYIAFHEHDSCDAVDALRGGLIQIPEAERMPLPEGSFYRDQIEGLHVYEENGRMLGRIDAIFETGSNDVYVVRAPEQGPKQEKETRKEYLIPALTTVVKAVDLSAGRIIIRPLSEWMDEDAV